MSVALVAMALFTAACLAGSVILLAWVRLHEDQDE